MSFCYIPYHYWASVMMQPWDASDNLCHSCCAIDHKEVATLDVIDCENYCSCGNSNSDHHHNDANTSFVTMVLMKNAAVAAAAVADSIDGCSCCNYHHTWCRWVMAAFPWVFQSDDYAVRLFSRLVEDFLGLDSVLYRPVHN